MATQGYGSSPGRRSSVATGAPSRAPTPKPKPIVASAMKKRKPPKLKEY